MALTLCTIEMSVAKLKSTLDGVDHLSINLISLLHPDCTSAISDLHHKSVNSIATGNSSRQIELALTL
jgi:hypothetical protein